MIEGGEHKMKKLLFLILVVLSVSLLAATYADISFPSALTVIEEETFMGDTSITGVMTIPSNIRQIKGNAFSGTNLFGLEIPADVQSIGSQSFNNAAYIWLHGNSTEIGSISGIQYLIGPVEGSPKTWAEKNGMEFVPMSALVEYNGFYYRNDPDGLTLMSAVNAEQLGSSVYISQNINGNIITGISPFAFVGCDNVQRIVLPEELLEIWNQADHPACPQIEPIAYTENLVRNVEASKNSGTVGSQVTWTVETEEGVEIVQYDYLLSCNGTMIDEQTSTNATYSYAPSSAGAYQLHVNVLAANGAAGNGSSTVLYIASESMKMTVPASIQNGQDLSIKVLEVPGAYFYGVYLTEESTGKSVGYKTINNAGTITFDGYLLDKGTYRVTGYVFGNDFRYTVPTVKTVMVTGTKASGPSIPKNKPAYLNRDYKVAKSGAEKHVVVYQFRYSNGTLSEEKEISGSGDL